MFHLQIYKKKLQAGLPAGRQGQTIIEAVIALTSIVLVLNAIIIAVTSSVNNSQFIRDQSLASKYSQTGMEHIRYIRNNPPPVPTPTFQTYVSTSQVNCMDSNNAITPAGAKCLSVNIPPYIREVSFEAISGSCSNGTKVTITVYFSSNKCGTGSTSERYCHKSQVTSCFSDQNLSGTSL